MFLTERGSNLEVLAQWISLLIQYAAILSNERKASIQLNYHKVIMLEKGYSLARIQVCPENGVHAVFPYLSFPSSYPIAILNQRKYKVPFSDPFGRKPLIWMCESEGRI